MPSVESQLFIGILESGKRYKGRDINAEGLPEVLITHEEISRIADEICELQYSFDEDPYNIVYQIDDLFRFVAIISDVKQYDKALAFIKKYVLQNSYF